MPIEQIATETIRRVAAGVSPQYGSVGANDRKAPRSPPQKDNNFFSSLTRISE
ncbi:MAG TPA: hypothetical protein IGS52_17955 [Oscillatoriaceae cyanobacterium M33_DOE_052]|nr:hypothetical protein [Oscillatoriaceae cyanobacterium M33_DOE_052]